MTAPHKDPHLIESGHTVLTEMHQMCRSLLYATLLTDDGFQIVSTPQGARQDERLASMSSSIQALADAVGRELTLGANEFVIIASDKGHIIQRRIPEHSIVLAAVFDTDETLGKALAISRRTGEKFAALALGLAQVQP